MNDNPVLSTFSLNSRTLLTILTCVYCFSLGAETLKVARVTPSGDDIQRTKSIVIEFDQNVIALGESLFSVEDVPITIKPAIRCEWNWVKRDALACNLPADSYLKLATEYTVTIKPGITTDSGDTLAEPYVHKFRTRLPTIIYSRVSAWVSPTRPIFYLNFDQPVQIDSLANRLVVRDESEQSVDTKIWVYDYYEAQTLENKFVGVSDILDRRFNWLQHNSSRAWFVMPNKALGEGHSVELVQLPYIQSTEGPLTREKEIVYPDVAKTFAEFRFLGLDCFDLNVNERSTVNDLSEIQSVSCAPDRRISLLFSSPIEKETVDNLLASNPPFTRAFHSPTWTRGLRWYFRDFDSTKQVAYNLPTPLQPNSNYELRFGEIDEAADSGMSPFQDVFGRDIQGIKRIDIKTGNFRPKLDLEGWFFVVESDVSTTIPTFTRNIDELSLQFTSLDKRGTHPNQVRDLKAPVEDNTVLIQDLGLRSIFSGTSGAMIGSIQATPRFEVQEDLMRKNIFAQATSYQVYVKESAVNTLVWVTDMQSGQPVTGARVELYATLPKDFAKVASNAQVSHTDEDGIARLNGQRVYNPNQKIDGNWEDLDCEEPDCRAILVKVTGERGIAVVPIISSLQLRMPSDSNSRRWISSWYHGDNIRLNVWGMTTQGIYHKGDTVRYKGYVRDWSDIRLQLPPDGRYSLEVRGPNWDVVYSEEAIELNEFGAFEGEFRLSKTTIMGQYSFALFYEIPVLIEQELENDEPLLHPIATNMDFFVSDFTPNPIKVSQLIHGDEFQFNDPFSVSTTSEFHAGGAYMDAPGRITVWIQPRSIFFNTEQAKKFRFNHSDRVARQTLLQRRTTLDKEGSQQTSIPKLKSKIYVGTLTVESAVQSDRGKYVTSRSSVPYRGVNRYIGLSSTDRSILQSGTPSSIETIVVSKKGVPKAGAPFEVKVYKRVTALARVQSGVTPTMFNRVYHTVWELVHQCTGVSTGAVSECIFTPEMPGQYRTEASVQDSNGNVHKSDLRLWVTGKEFVLWEEDLDDRNKFLKLSCVDSELEVGERVRCVVQNPLVNSSALITVERGGIIDQFVQWFDSSTPVIDFEVKPEYMPGFFLSVIIASPRVGDSSPDLDDPDWVDLGIPNYRLGYASFDVSDPTRDLTLKVTSNRNKYEPRDKVTLTIASDRTDRHSLPVEYAVVVLDEAVLDLIESRSSYFDPSDAFDRFSQLGVINYSLIRKLIGFRTEKELEEVLVTSSRMLKSGTEFGGGGLTDDIRTIDKFVAYWNPSVVAEKGRSKLSFELPDYLTSWRVFVLAATTDNRFGFTQTSFTSTKDTEIRPTVPNIVSKGDTFDVGISILNRARRTRTLDVELVLSGLLARDEKSIHTTKVTLAPYERKTVTHTIQAGHLNFLEVSSPNFQKISLIARAQDRSDQDSLKVEIPVRASRVKVTSVDYGILAEDTVQIPINTAQLSPNGGGALTIDLSTHDFGSLEGVFGYARAYPYNCWEQKIFQAVMAMQSKKLQAQTGVTAMSRFDADEVINAVLETASDFQAPNGGMTFFVPSNNNVNAYLSAFTALAFTWIEDSGYEVDARVVTRLHEYLREVLRDSQSFALGSSQARATIRAVALNALSRTDGFTHEDLSRFVNEVQNMNLFGLAHFLIAATNSDNAQTIAGLAFDTIMNDRTLVDGSVEFVESVPSIYNFILNSHARTNCVVLEALSRFSKLAPDQVERDEMFPLVQTVMSFRGDREHWSNTQENVYCVNALLTYSTFFDTDKEFIASINLESSDGSEVNLASGLELGVAQKSHRLVHSLASTIAPSKDTLSLRRDGNGNGFYTVELSYLAAPDASLTRLSGFELDREYLVKRNGGWHPLARDATVEQGEIVKVNLFLTVPATRYHVVVDDTVPGGIEPVSRILATDSVVDLEAEDKLSPKSAWFHQFEHARGNPWPFYHTEKGHENVRFFAKQVHPGRYRMSWVGQAIISGEFQVVPAHTEEMYRPEVFGKSTSRVLRIEP
ncbi:MAG: hypothetical protein F4Z14_03345 [Gammaproteobacteria bacterium]|nr:hypothetical protein [Gammaproteobacteria bacterium]